MARSDPAARALLTEAYTALELPLDPATVGSVSEVRGRPVTFAPNLAGELAVYRFRRP